MRRPGHPTAVRLVLLVAAAVALLTVGTFRHRQGPFVLSGAALAYVGIGLFAPYAPLLPRWITLTWPACRCCSWEPRTNAASPRPRKPSPGSRA